MAPFCIADPNCPWVLLSGDVNLQVRGTVKLCWGCYKQTVLMPSFRMSLLILNCSDFISQSYALSSWTRNYDPCFSPVVKQSRLSDKIGRRYSPCQSVSHPIFLFGPCFLLLFPSLSGPCLMIDPLSWRRKFHPHRSLEGSGRRHSTTGGRNVPVSTSVISIVTLWFSWHQKRRMTIGEFELCTFVVKISWTRATCRRWHKSLAISDYFLSFSDM